MEIQISSHLCSLIPDFKVGIIHYENIEVGESPQMLKDRFQSLQESLFSDMKDKYVTDLEGIKEWRTIFRKTGKDPNRYRHSAEALYRRVKKHHFLSSVNSAIDLNNFYSLQYEIPLGIYDKGALSGIVTIRIGEDGETYYGLNGRENNLHKLIITADDQGPFGSPFVDSERSAVKESTRNAIHFVYLRPSHTVQEAEKILSSLMNMFLQFHGGSGKYRIVGCSI